MTLESPPLRRHPRYPLGVALCLLAGVCLSTGGFIVRHIEDAGGWQILFFRAVGYVAALFLFLLFHYRGRVARPFADVGAPGLVIALSLGLGFACYLFAILMTTVANTVFIVSSSPFFAAVLAWLILGEQVSRRAWAAIACALAGMAIMFGDGLVAGHWLGDLVALGAAVTFAIMLVAIRFAGERDMVPATCLAGLVVGLISYLMAPDLEISLRDAGLSLLLGAFQVGAGFLLVTLGTRYVPAAEAALLTLSEAVLAPLWVWLAFAESPSGTSLLGGLIVLAAVAAHAVTGLAKRPKPPS